MNFGGLKPIPTPTGVPVAIISPGINVIVEVIVSINVGISNIKSATLASCLVSPFIFVTKVNLVTS